MVHNKLGIGGTGYVPPLGSTDPTAPASGVAKPKPVDGIDGATGTLFGAASGAAKKMPPVLTGSIATHFPIDDLGAIETRGRWATGFSLDGGSVRLMWINARRVNDEADKRGFEISFFLQGPAIGKLKERLEKRGATKGSMPFYGAELAPNAAPGKDTLVRNATTWSPGGQALVLDVADKYTVHLVESAPEALKGAVRIRVYGDDASSNAGFAEAINKLGLQHVFAPPTETSLERLKLARLLWSTDPSLLERALWPAPADLDAAQVTKRYEALELPADHPSRKAIAAIDLADPATAKRASLALLLWSASPKAFFEWAKSDSYSQHGILPSGSSDYALNTALTNAGIKSDAPEYVAATTAKPSLADARKLFELGLVIKTAPAAAEELMLRSLDQVPPSKLEELVHTAGIDTSNDRLAKLEFREVYPGYFTAYDPSRPQRLRDKGACYLYSTLDNPERVFEVLTGGQKSSFTRFQEGKLVQGKSSSSDFGTGGAFSIFTRLVTESAVEAAKKKKSSGGSSGGYYGTTGFNNWGGSRPYKVILNRSVLGRLDWYGYNGDNFGRSTGLKAANHGEKIVETIEKSYSASNELMFPVGNDPKNIDFVVCETQQQKDALLKLLGERGITTFNGKPIDQVVRIETMFFVHPDDMTVEAAIKEATEGLKLEAAEHATRQVAGAFAKAHAPAETLSAAQAVAAEALPKVIESLSQSAGQYVAQQQASTVIGSALAQLPPSLEQAALDAAKAAAETAGSEPPASLASNAKWTVQNQLRSTVQTKMIGLLEELGPAIAASAAEAAKAAQAPGADVAAVKVEVRAAVRAALLSQGKSAAAAAVKAALAEDAQKAAAQAIQQNATYTARNAVLTPMTDAALAAARAKAQADGTIEAWRQALMQAGKEPVRASVQSSLDANLKSSLRSQVQSQTKPKAEASMIAALGEAAKTAARSAALSEVKSTVAAAVTTFQAAHPDKPITQSEEALIAVGLLKADAVATWFTGAEVGTSIDPLLQGAIDQAVAEKASADHGPLVAQRIGELLEVALESQLTQQLRNKLSPATSAAADAVASARAAAWVEAVAPALGSEVLGQLADQLQPYTLESVVAKLAEAEVAKLG